MATSHYTSSDIDRFWAKVDKSAGNDACWIWTGYIHWKGYGQFSVSAQKRTRRAHRVAYEIKYGKIPDGAFVCHKCDNRSCCNPAHLFLGSPQDNTSDMIIKGRQSQGEYHSLRTPRGEAHRNHKLTRETVESIRKRYESGGTSQRSLAAEFNVSKTLIANILHKRAWK